MEALKQLQDKVKMANAIYDKTRQLIKIPENQPYQRVGIRSLSEPFVKGVFTLAVVGPMSSGKSSFINALLEDEDLLPTGHFQTTCTLTEIVYSREKKLRVMYGDGHEESYQGDEILKKIKELAAVPKEFNMLPINHINKFILAGGESEVLANKKYLVEKAGVPIDDELLREYCRLKSPQNIPVHLWVEYPLADSYMGWRIVDTPGIGARGGIDEITKDFLVNDTVDSVIFLFNGKKEIDNNEIIEAVKTSYAQLTDVAKERTFFVVTHAGARECWTNLTETMDMAYKLFSEGNVRIPRERFFVVDNMLSVLYDRAIKQSNLDPTIFKGSRNDNLRQWGVDEIVDEAERKEEIKVVDNYRGMIAFLWDRLEEKDLEQNTENLSREIYEVAGFGALKENLGEFAKRAKQETFDRIREKIAEDFAAFGSKKKEDYELLGLKMTKSPAEFRNEIEKKKREVDGYRVALSEQYNELMIKYNASNITTFTAETEDYTKRLIDKEMAYDQFENILHNFYALLEKDQRYIESVFSRDCDNLIKCKQNIRFAKIVLPPIDVEGAMQAARQAATEVKTDVVMVRKSGPISWLKYFIGKKIKQYDLVRTALEEKTISKEIVDESKMLVVTKDNLKAYVGEVLEMFAKEMYYSRIKPAAENIQSQLDSLVETKNKEYQALIDLQAVEEKIHQSREIIMNDIETLSEKQQEIRQLMVI